MSCLALPTLHTHAAWAGLALRGDGLQHDLDTLHDVLGNQAPFIVAGPHEPPLAVVRELMLTRASALLMPCSDSHASLLLPLVKVLGSLSSFRRVVLLHTPDCEAERWSLGSALLLLRDGPEVRATLRELVQRDLHRATLPAACNAAASMATERAHSDQPSPYAPPLRLARPGAARHTDPDPFLSRFSNRSLFSQAPPRMPREASSPGGGRPHRVRGGPSP